MSVAKYKVVMTDSDKWPVDVEKEILGRHGMEFVPAVCRTEDDSIRLCRDADAILNGAAMITRRVISRLEKCLVVVRYGVGLDTIDIPAATEAGICVGHVPDFCWDEVADTAMSLILAATRKVAWADRLVRRGVYSRKELKPVFKAKGRVVGLVAFGNIARHVAERARAFGFRVIAYDPNVPQEVFDRCGVRRAEFEELLKTSDVISIHTPLTEKTRGMFDEAQFRMMKKTAYIVNTGRGPVIRNKALYRALTEGWIAGAGLDVLEKEPPDKDEPLLTLDNVVFTPHYASYTEEAYHELHVKVTEQAVQVLRGEWRR
jgi:D-3-phosphoglycerate dehydrogenase